MHSQMERMKAEAMVDIFQFIKAVRIQRAGLVTTQVCIMTISPITESFIIFKRYISYLVLESCSVSLLIIIIIIICL